MSFESKAMFTLLLDAVAKSKSVKEAYNVIARAARACGADAPTFMSRPLKS